MSLRAAVTRLRDECRNGASVRSAAWIFANQLDAILADHPEPGEPERCVTCGGSGYENAAGAPERRCGTCQGTGVAEPGKLHAFIGWLTARHADETEPVRRAEQDCILAWLYSQAEPGEPTTPTCESCRHVRHGRDYSGDGYSNCALFRFTIPEDAPAGEAFGCNQHAPADHPRREETK